MRVPLPLLLAGVFVAGIAGWMLTGDFVAGGDADASPPTIAERNADTETELFKVRVKPFEAQTQDAVLQIRGRTQADSVVSVVAETTAIVSERSFKKGDVVQAGSLLCTLNAGAREAQVAQAKAQVAEATLSYEASKTLVGNGYASKTTVQADKAALDAAKAGLAAAELEMGRTKIYAPVSGIVQDPIAEVGNMLSAGMACATVMKPDPMLMTGQVSETEIAALSAGMEADVRLITGQLHKGEIVYIAPSSDPETRTFRVEIKIANPDGVIKDGVTSTAFLSLGGDPAHLIPASILTLADDGRIGVKIIDENNVAAFGPVTVLGDQDDGIWVTGLPERVMIVTLGQEYIVDGQTVDVQIDVASNQATRDEEIVQ